MDDERDVKLVDYRAHSRINSLEEKFESFEDKLSDVHSAVCGIGNDDSIVLKVDRLENKVEALDITVTNVLKENKDSKERRTAFILKVIGPLLVAGGIFLAGLTGIGLKYYFSEQPANQQQTVNIPNG